MDVDLITFLYLSGTGIYNILVLSSVSVCTE